MSLSPLVLNSVVRITTAGDLLGSGTIVGVDSESAPGKRWPYVVTAHHVVRSQMLIEVDVPDPTTRGQWTEGVSVNDWSQPLEGIDLAIAPFPIQSVPLTDDGIRRYQTFLLDHFVPDGHVPPLGAPIHYAGVFAPTGVPMLRTGNIAALDVPIERDNSTYSYRADLVDCRSYKGFSGSPCLSTITYAVLDGEPVELAAGVVPPNARGVQPRLGRTASEARFCGIFTAHFTDEGAEDADGVISRYGVGVMLPSDYVRDALMSGDAVAQRRSWDAAADGPADARNHEG